MKNFFRLFKPEDRYAIPRIKKETNFLIFPDDKIVGGWEQPLFIIPKKDGIISDYLSSDIGGRLCSNKLKTIIEAHKGENDIIQWLPVDIYDEESGTVLKYYHLHFPEPPDCLSRNHCKYNPASGRVMVPVYSYKKIKNRHIFNSSGGYETVITLLSENMKKAIEAAGCTGLDLDKANVIYDEEEPIRAVS